MISWLHFGDLHISGQEEQNYRDFQQGRYNSAARHAIDYGNVIGEMAGEAYFGYATGAQ